jgi:hypothetical protein
LVWQEIHVDVQQQGMLIESGVASTCGMLAAQLIQPSQKQTACL